MNDTNDLFQLESILNNAVDSIITIDARGVIESANPATERLFGYTNDEVVGQNVSMLMPPPYREDHDGYIDRYLQSGVAKIIGAGREVTAQRKDGSTFPVHLAVSEVRQGEMIAFTGIVRDISDLKAVEHELTRMNETLESLVAERTKELSEAQAELRKRTRLEMLGRVSGNLTHEIRNPLNAMRTSIYFLTNARNVTPYKAAEHLDRIDRQVTWIDKVITALFDVNRLSVPNRKPLILTELLRTVVRAVDMPPDIEVSWLLANQLPRAYADEGQMLIVFQNLVRNARDAMGESGTLTISVVQVDDTIAVSVRDTGCGIPANEIDKIMDPLFTTKPHGIGLGLAIARAIVLENNAEIKVESETGVGSEFTVSLRAAGMVAP